MTNKEMVLEVVNHKYMEFTQEMLKETARKVYTEHGAIKFYCAISDFFNDVDLDNEEYEALAKLGNELVEDLHCYYIKWDYASVATYGDTEAFIRDYIELVSQEYDELTLNEKVIQRVEREFNTFKTDMLDKPSEEIFDECCKIRFYTLVHECLTSEELVDKTYENLDKVQGSLISNMWERYLDLDINFTDDYDTGNFITEYSYDAVKHFTKEETVM